ncbi:MAG: GNAT family N-acetyltransferase [Lysinibacillus sp.]
MLVRYKKSLEKIAMGLLSFMPQGKEVKHLMETINQYEDIPNWMLHLWKIDEEYVGIVGMVVEDDIATIQHVTVVPSYRGEGVALEMLKKLQQEFCFKAIKPTEETQPFIEKCLENLKGIGA